MYIYLTLHVGLDGVASCLGFDTQFTSHITLRCNNGVIANNTLSRCTTLWDTSFIRSAFDTTTQC
jgi:hypothetical protein